MIAGRRMRREYPPPRIVRRIEEDTPEAEPFADATTPNLGLVQPEVGASNSTWGNKWNANAAILDNLLPLAGGAITGALSVAGQLTAAGGLIATNGIIQSSSATGNPTISVWSQVTNSAFGFWCYGPDMFFGSFDGLGNPITPLAWFDNVGDFNTANDLATAGTVYCANLSASGNVYASSAEISGTANVVGNLSAGTLSTGGSADVGGDVFGANLITAGGVYGTDVVASGQGFKPGGGLWADSSDERLKRDIVDYEVGLNAVCQLRPVRYQFNGLGSTIDDGRTHTGLIAQEARRVMPELVGTRREQLRAGDPEDTEILTLDPTPLFYALVNSVQELRTMLHELKTQNGALLNRIRSWEERI